MNILQSNIDQKKLIQWLYIVFLLFFPFGSTLLPISLKYITVYPSLILLLIIFVISLKSATKIFKFIPSIYKYFLIFLVIWLFQAVAWLPFVTSVKDALIDIRSIGLFFLHAWGLLYVYFVLGKKFWQINRYFFTAFYFFLAIVALFEINTGIHFAGHFTDKLTKLPIGNITYNPVFIYDNPNNFAVYLTLTGLLAFISFDVKKINPAFFLMMFLFNFMIYYIISGRIGYIVFYLSIAWLIYYLIFKYRSTKAFRPIFLQGLLMLTGFVILFLTLPKYYGPIWQNNQNDRKIYVTKKPGLNVNESSTLIELKYLPYLNKDTLDERFTSTKIRIALLANGWEYIKQTKFMGVGPGQFRYLHSVNQKKYYTKTNIGPHFWLMEIFSQYGIIIFLSYVVLWVWALILLFKKMNINHVFLLYSILVFFLVSAFPSGFLILDIQWIFTSVVLLKLCDSSKIKTNNEGNF